MPLVEAVTIEVGAAIAKSILKLWVKDSSLGEDIASSLIDLFKARTSDALAQRRGQRQFEAIGERVGESLLPLFEIEGARLDESSRTAVAIAVAEAFNRTKLTSALLAQRNLEPTELARDVLAAHPTATDLFSMAETAFYGRIIHESCVYIVDIASQLPAFTEQTFAEVLKREDQILSRTDEILKELRGMRAQLDPRIDDQRFEIDYRQAVARNLDVLHLIGADVSPVNRRHRLSVAYITLSAARTSPPVPTTDAPSEVLPEEAEQNFVSVETVLAGAHRLLVRGQTGSGKTTLLQWVAVRAATRSFPEPLSHWNDHLPFFIRLRQCVHSGLPRPEDFPGFVAPAIAGTMPKGWVHATLKAGHALVLVDGLDEIPASQREDVSTWLNDLVETYPAAHYIITSRPYAIEEGWMDQEGLQDAELQPMEQADIFAFIDHWHEAVREELQTEEERRELAPLAENLKEQVRRTRTIRTLATSPLLCAMLCALNRERRRQLPVNRIELYRACCALLLERRDKDSHVDLSDYPALNYSQKQRLLEDLAYWMLQEDLSEADLAVVDARFTRKLAQMPGVSLEVTGAQVRKLLVERAGIIREPVASRIDFTHRTFQEFFAAQAALNAMDIDVLVANAHNDQWREVIILAAGLAPETQCTQLVRGLIQRGDDDHAHRHHLYLLAVSCLETAIELESQVKAEVEKRLSKLVPPRNMTDAKALAAAGELAVKYLVKKASYTAAVCAACVRTLATIGGDAALDVLEGYARDERERVVKELVKAWDAFDRGDYARRVLNPMLLKRSTLHLERISSLEGLNYVTNVTELNLLECDQLSDLTPLSSLTNITRLDMRSCHRVNDLTPLGGLVGLRVLNMIDCPGTSNLTPIFSLTNLTELNLNKCPQVSDLTPLTGLTNLTRLDLYNYPQVSDLTPLTGLINLIRLDLSSFSQVSDLTPLAGLTNLTRLDLYNCPRVRDLAPLAGLTNLTWLRLSNCQQISDLAPLSGLTNLTELRLFTCAQVSDLAPLSGLTNLTWLRLYDCSKILDFSSLTNLTKLHGLVLSNDIDRSLIPQSIMKKVAFTATIREMELITSSTW